MTVNAKHTDGSQLIMLHVILIEN